MFSHPILRILIFGFIFLGFQPLAWSCDASTEAELSACISGSDATINITADITLTSTQTIDRAVTIEGDGKTIEGNDTFRLLIVNASSGSVEINDITLTNGDAGTTNANNCSTGGSGGAICKEGNSTLTINRSTISDSDGLRGGGIYILSGGDLYIYNTVLTGNSATWGGGFYNRGAADVYIAYSTIESNTSTSGSSFSGGGAFNFGIGTVEIKSSIIINNSGLSGKEDCDKNSGSLTSQGYNLVGSGTGCPSSGTGDDDSASASDIFDSAPTLKNDAANPALDAIASGTNSCGTSLFDEDYLGTSRPKGAGSQCDIGAHELNADSIAPTFNTTETKIDTGSVSDTDTEFDIIAQVDEDATIYYVILAESATAPDASQVRAGNDSSDSAVSLSGSFAATANTPATESITGLTPATEYTVYLIAEDASGNGSSTSDTVIDLDQRTTDSTAPTITASTSNADETSFDLVFQIDELGTVYYVIVTDGSGAPTTAQIAAGNDSTGSSAIVSNSVNITTANSDVTENITGLDPATNYDVYLYAEDDEASPNESSVEFKEQATTADTDAPVFNTQSISNETGSSFKITVQLDEVSTVYYVVVTDGTGEPSKSQIKAGNDATGSSAVKSGSINITTANADEEVTVSGLSYNTNYDVYLYAEDDETSPNESDVDLQEVTTIPDTTAPSFSSSSVSDTGSSSVDITVTLDEDSTVYYVVVLDGETAPTATEVKNAQASGGGSPETSGNFAVTANNSTTEIISGLDSETVYDIYLVAEDDSSNLSGTTSLDATTDILTYTVSISKSGSGSGTTSGGGSYEPGDSVTLTANASSNSTFSGWSGDDECSSSFTMPSSNVSCTAKFTNTDSDNSSNPGTPVQETVYHNLQVNITGRGDFSSDQIGLNCSPQKDNCQAYREYLTVTLTPEPSQGYRLKSLSGDCSTSGEVFMDGRKTCQLTFERLPAYSMVIQKSGKGLGTITSSDGVLNCGSACRTSYTADITTTLTATADNDKTQFTGWSCIDGLQATDATIDIPMTQNRTCTASFLALYSLTTYVNSVGGTLSYEDSLTCNADNSPCTQNYPEGTIQLTSTPNAGYVALWGAECPQGQINLSSDQTCSVSFTPSYSLSLQVIGNGSITSNPVGIDCQEGNCSASYIQGETIQLIATPEFGNSFIGWTGDCSNGQTTLTMNSDKICTATFANTGSPQFSQEIYAATEKQGTVTITVDRVEGSNGAMSVTYIVTNGSAVAPNDFTAASGILTWADGDVTPKTFDITIATDPVTEDVETAKLQLLNQTNTILDEAELQIADTFVPANLNFVSTRLTGNDQDQAFFFPVSRSIAFSGAIQVDFSVTAGNYTSQGTLYWADGDSDNQLIGIPKGIIPAGVTVINATMSNPQPAELVTLGSKTAATLTIQETPTAGEVSFTNSEFSMSEGRRAIITVERTGATNTEASVDYILIDGTATPTTDYQGANGTFRWELDEAGQKTFSIKVETDAIQEETETVNLQLVNPVGTRLGAIQNAVLQILDVTSTPITGETPPPPPVNPDIPTLPPEPSLGVVEFEQTDYVVNENDGTVMIKIVRTPDTTGTINVQLASKDSSAVSGRDYTTVSQQLRWVNDDTSPREIQVGLLDNASNDGNRSFVLELTNTSQVDMIGEKSIAQINIVDNDSSQVRFEKSSYSVAEDQSNVILKVVRAVGLDAATIGYRTNSTGSAQSGEDFEQTRGELNWQAGDTRSKNIIIPIINDNQVEQTERFTVDLFVTGTTQVLSPSSATVSIADDDSLRTEPVVNPDTGNTLINGQVSNQAQPIGETGKTTFINENGSVTNATLAGEIENDGVLEDVTLTAGTTVTGGVVRGSAIGTPEQPALLKNVTIESGTRLDNVIIGRGSSVADDVILGENVRFTDNTVIPAVNLELLTGVFTPPDIVQTFFGVFAVNLLTDVITNPSINGILGSINGLQEFIEYGVEMQQETTYGFLTLQIDSIVYPLLPVRLSQVLPDQLRDNKPYVGLHVKHNAEVTFITHTGRNIVAVPVVYAPEQFLAALSALGLGQAVMDITGNIRIEATDTEYLSVRASLLSPEVSSSTAGIQYVDSAYLSNVSEMLFTYTDIEGVLRQQTIYPAPIDNNALANMSSSVDIYMNGRVIAKNAQDQVEFNGLLGYNIDQAVAEVSESISIQEIEDVNADGLLDYRLIYPNGDAQILYRVE